MGARPRRLALYVGGAAPRVAASSAHLVIAVLGRRRHRRSNDQLRQRCGRKREGDGRGERRARAPTPVRVASEKASERQAGATPRVQDHLPQARRRPPLREGQHRLAQHDSAIRLAAGHIAGAQGRGAELAGDAIEEALGKGPEMHAERRVAELSLHIGPESEQHRRKEYTRGHAPLEDVVSVARRSAEAGHDTPDVEHGAHADEPPCRLVLRCHAAPDVHTCARSVAHGRSELADGNAVEHAGDGGVERRHGDNLAEVGAAIQGCARDGCRCKRRLATRGTVHVEIGRSRWC
mmetsp:Transcript_65795/g.189684  ORF Transcript_65795/g.189684 Transcript_65795/m.189684 type:complete len:293 (+) Transcript_65795:99-977(+)